MQTPNSKHTPGPWQTSGDYSVCSESGLHITGVLGYGALPETNRANARLIAAAPELLAACQIAVQLFDAGMILPPELPNAARAAIKKAGGAKCALQAVSAMKTQTEQIEILTEALRSILTQDAGDLSDAAFRRYVCDVIAAQTLAKIEGGAK